MGRELSFGEYRLEQEPYYMAVGDEVEIFRAASACKLPVLLKGPTGCGKTRFVEYMAYQLRDTKHPPPGSDASPADNGHPHSLPLITVACHEDLTASDLVGRFLLKGGETVWVDGPLTQAVRSGAICYLDEIVEARKDTTVLIHALTDHRRILPIEKRGEILEAHANFLLVISYNPGYQSVIKDLKHSTRQRFVAIEFDYPPRELETAIITHESGVDCSMAAELARIGEKVRNLRDHGLEEGVSTRLLIYAGQLITQGIPAQRACQLAITKSITDDLDVQRAVAEVISTILP
ncbi:MAG: CbbQ/NirQ/NorQ/GpvN family protein [Nitrospinae bacterium]|nr:CbbQ/NirQ/NorQ/GpvN family protein [Nitrospinota bacterium]